MIFLFIIIIMMSGHHPIEHPSHVVKKRTIIKDRVGCVRTSTYHLPGDHHTYGRKTEQVNEGAAECKCEVLFSCRRLL